MDENSIFEKIKHCMNEQWGQPEYAEDMGVEMNSNFRDDLQYDSLDAVELLMKVEQAFNISIPDKEANEIETVLDLIHSVQHNKK